MTAPETSIWLREGVQPLLIKLHGEGLSCGQIAGRMNIMFPGLGVSRNSVIGKLSRMHIRRAPGQLVRATVWTLETTRKARDLYEAGRKVGEIASLVGTTPAAVYAKANAMGWTSPRLKAPASRTDAQPPRSPAVVEPLADTKPRHWTTRQARECAFPVSGEGADVYSCCARAVPGMPYCRQHAAICFNAPKNVGKNYARSLRRYAA